MNDVLINVDTALLQGKRKYFLFKSLRLRLGARKVGVPGS